MDVPAIILAGGLGKRLQGVINDVPKPMAPVNGKPFLHYVFQYLANQEIGQAILSVGYKYESIESHFKHNYLGISISYSVEAAPMGTGGGILQAFAGVKDYAFVLNGDTLFGVKLSALRNFYFDSKADIAIGLKQLFNFDRYGTVCKDPSGRITSFVEKQSMAEGLVNGGIYFFDKSVFDKVGVKGKFSFETEVLEKGVQQLNIQGMVFDNYFIDIGVPGDYKRAQDELE